MADTIREFLVGLGFDIDERGLKRFEEGVNKVTAPVVRLGEAAVVAATAVGVMVTSVARQMEDLYYASQRTHATAESLQAVGFAAQQVGLQAGQGKDMLEGLARAMRTNPGTEGMLNAFGVRTREASGSLRDMTGTLDDLLRALAQMPRYQALALAPRLGLDPETLSRVLDNLPAFQRAQEESRRILREFGVDSQKLAEQSKDFDNALGSLTAKFSALAQRVAQDWLPVAKQVVDYANSAADAFARWYTSLDDTGRKAVDVGAAVAGAWGISKVMGKIKSFFGGGGAAAGASGSGLLGGLLQRLPLIGAATTMLTPSDANTGEDEEVRRFKANPRAYGIDADPAPPVSPATPPAPAGDQSAGNRVTGYFIQQGWSKEQAAAIAGALQGESGFDPKAYNPAGGGQGAHGIAQWRGDRIAEFERLYGKRILDATLDEQLAYVQHELTQGRERYAGMMLRGATSLEQAADTFTRLYERGGFEDIPRRLGYSQHWLAQVSPTAALRVAGTEVAERPVTVNQTNTVTVTGSSDPAETGRRIGEEQSRANGDLARNLAAAVR